MGEIGKNKKEEWIYDRRLGQVGMKIEKPVALRFRDGVAPLIYTARDKGWYIRINSITKKWCHARSGEVSASCRCRDIIEDERHSIYTVVRQCVCLNILLDQTLWLGPVPQQTSLFRHVLPFAVNWWNWKLGKSWWVEWVHLNPSYSMCWYCMI